jgi:hypothetical protein
MTLVSTQPIADSACYDFYRDALGLLEAAGIPFLVGGAFAFREHTGIDRVTKDFDIFIRRDDMPRVMSVMRDAGYDAELTFPHWLGKIRSPVGFIDVIFSSGNGEASVDDEWFAHAKRADVLGLSLAVCPPEEALWSKAFVMERERYDGADIAHIIKAQAERLDWARLRRRFGERWRVLLAHLILFGFIYPSDRGRVPAELMEELIGWLRAEEAPPRQPLRICNGPVLSWSQYLGDLDRFGLIDGRLPPEGKMTPEEIAAWTAADKS